jgi:uncharacterized protein (DUF983 family)
MEKDDKLFTALQPKDECSICSSDITEDEGGVQGYFGILPVTFCVWCYTSMLDMVEQLNDVSQLEGEEDDT